MKKTMKKILSLLLVAVMMTGIGIIPSATIPANAATDAFLEDSVEFNGHYYKVISIWMSQNDANDYCNSLGGYLATITSAEENNIITAFIADKGENVYMLGLYENPMDNKWYWLNGEKVSYTNWGRYQPDNYGNQDAGAIASYETYISKGKWDDITGSSGHYFICEWDSKESITLCTNGHDWNISADGKNYVCKVCGEQTTIEKGIPDDAIEFNGHYYKAFENGLTWENAKIYCENVGGHLATITSKEENEFVASLMVNTDNTVWEFYFLGASDVEQEGVWKWVTNESWSYSNWDRVVDMEPNNKTPDQDYLAIQGYLVDANAYGSWDDVENDEYALVCGFICEWDSKEEKPGLGTDETSQISRGTYYGTYESSLLSVFIDDENGYGYISEITVDGNTYKVDQDFSLKVDILGNESKYRDKEVVIYVFNGKIVDLQLIDELDFALESSITFSDQQLTYIDKKYNKESVQLAVYAYVPCNPSNFSGNAAVLADIPELHTEITSLTLTSSNADILSFNGEETCEISFPPISITYGQSKLLTNVTLDVNTDYRIPKNVLYELILISADVNGKQNNTEISDSVTYSINIDNLGKNKPSSSATDSDGLEKSIKEASKELKELITNENTAIVWSKKPSDELADAINGKKNVFFDIFSDEELDAIVAEIFTCLILKKAAEEEVEKSFGDEVLEWALDLDPDWFKVVSNKTVTITKTKKTEKYGNVKAKFTCDITQWTSGSGVYTGIISCELSGNGLSQEKTQVAQFYSADTGAFYESMLAVAEDMSPSIKDIIEGATSDTLDVLFKTTIEEVVYACFNSDSILKSITNFFKSIKADCPVDINVYNSAGDLVTSIVNNEIILNSENAKAVIVGDSKIVWLSDDSYTVEYRSLAEYNMKLTIKEYGSTDTLLRTVVIEDIPLLVGTDYTQFIDDTILEDTNYSIVSTQGDVIEPASDTTTLHTHIPAGDFEVIDVATCTEYGFKCALCTVCNEWCREIIPAKGHDYQTATIIATCTQNGKLMYTCSACADSYYDEIPATGHADEDKNGFCDFCSGVFESEVLLGDVDGNGIIDSSDARLALRAAVKLETLTDVQTKVADADGDGEISSSDARLILRAAVGLEKLK